MKNNRTTRLLRIASTAFLTMVFLLTTAFFSLASDAKGAKGGKYPSHAIKIMVSAGASGSLGNEIRAIAPYIEKNLGVRLVIEYVTGAEGMIAYNKFSQEKPNGYTLLYNNLISALVLELTRSNANFHVKSYTPVCGWNAKYQVLLVPPDTWKTFAEFIADAKKKTPTLAGTGGHTILNVKVLETALGIKINLVPYAASGEGIAAVAGKHVDSLLTYETTPKPMIQAGKLKALGILSLKPDPILPDVPDLKELGYPGITILPAIGNIAAPPKTPKEIVAVLEKAFKKAAANPELAKIANNLGIYVDFMSSAEMRKETDQQYNVVDKYKQFIK